MSAVFPKWMNRLPLMIVVGVLLIGGGVVAGVWYYFTPKYTRVGYQPIQPVAFSHKVHVDQLGMDCRYCHHDVERSWFSNIPSASTCMSCHNQVLKDDPRLALVRESVATGRPIAWVQVHKVPDYVYFNHAVHVNRGISCVECHGRIDQMEEVYHAKPLSMSFCLDCHRDPASFIRPLDKITDLGWRWSEDPAENTRQQQAQGRWLVEHWRVESLQNCSACHR
ncbi:cytochrome c3 family protein [Limisphaera ngatamarikiensis]|uniref:Cytochrome c3 family protein n=1 Tax=Limisphaera ngatamarikiensis TaxID=1324935 RepID=A0A6M1RLC4_9BACT|nr:cytochrome c3 family protein [Limisphaera ngatamarikiensis]